MELVPTLLKLLAALALVALNAFFVASEFALVRVRPTRLRELAEDGLSGAGLALRLVERLNATLSVIQLGITVASIGLGWLGEPAIAQLIEPVLTAAGAGSPVVVHTAGTVIAFALVTLLHVVLGELAPKTLAIVRPEPTALAIAWPMYAFFRLSWPLVFVFNETANAALRLMGIRPADHPEPVYSEDELRMLIRASQQSGVLDESERDLIDNVFDYADRVVREVMTSRPDAVMLDINLPFDRLVERAIQAGHTRYPVYDGQVENLVGLVHVKDLLALAWRRARGEEVDIRQAIRALPIVPETMSLDELRRRFQEQRVHMAAVVDEYGVITGLVTVEDLVEELVGELRDEFDPEEPPQIVAHGGAVEAEGSVLLEDLQEHLHWELPARFQDVDTIGGVVLTALGRPPRVGDVVRVAGHRIEVTAVDGLRVERVRILREGTPEQSVKEGDR